MSEDLVVIKNDLAITPMAMIQIAVQQGADIDKLSKLMDLQERYEANEARKAFVSAMSLFKANPPDIFKRKKVEFGNTKFSHADLGDVAIAVGESLSKQGLSHRWNTSQADGKIKVTCVITHNMGHSEEVSLESGADTSGQKNGIQAIGSTVTYLQRYTLLAVTGMAAQDQDDDGKGSEISALPDPQFQEFKKRIEATLTKETAKAVWHEAVKVCEQFKDTGSANLLKTVMLNHAKFIDSAKAKEAA